MPDDKGKLTQEERETARKWLKAEWKSWACPFSGHTNWELGDTLVQTTAFAGGGLVVGGPVYPMIIIICSGCGNTVLINAIKAGVVSKEEGQDVAG